MRWLIGGIMSAILYSEGMVCEEVQGLAFGYYHLTKTVDRTRLCHENGEAVSLFFLRLLFDTSLHARSIEIGLAQIKAI